MAGNKTPGEVAEFDLLEKTELRIQGISLGGVNLNDVAAVVANALGMDREEVLVTDAQDDVMTIDLLRKTVNPYRLVGKKDILFEKLNRLPGVEITEEASVCAEGMLGWIAWDEVEGRRSLERSQEMAAEIREKISKRAMIFSTGSEVFNGQIEDTNQPTIARRLEAEGYSVILGPTLKDDKETIAGQLRQAAETGGYGLVITTGGVGAEAKDCTVEALLEVDAEAATPYICRFEPGTGRHTKDGVRIGVGELLLARIVALPGPNDEVRSSLEILIRGLKSGKDKHDMAEEIARNLRQDLRQKMKHGHH